jgi:SAM-dependent methyltransferase
MMDKNGCESDNKIAKNMPYHQITSDTICGKQYYRTDIIRCPLCGQEHTSRMFNVQFGMKVIVAECSSCRLAYQTPRPSVEACQAYMDMRWNSSDLYVKDAKGQQLRAEKQMQYVKNLSGGTGNLLDFGAGIGTFVQSALAQGWQAKGVERNASAIIRAKKENGVELYREIPDGNYDVITLWDVVEHLHNPREMFMYLKNFLRPEGYLIMETVNWENWLRLALGDKWNLYLFDHHFYFSPPSLKEQLARCGLHNFILLNTKPVPPIFRTFLHIGFNRSTWHGYWQAKKLWSEHYAYNVMTAVAQLPAEK